MINDKKLRIRTSDIPTSWLNARCRNLISKYSLVAFRDDGSVFDLRSSTILSELSMHSRKTENSELKDIYQMLKNELRIVVSTPALQTALNIMAEKYNYLEDNIIH